MIRRSCYAHAAANRSTRSGIPCDIHVVAQSTAGIRVRRDHRLIVKVVGTVFKREEVNRWISLATVGRLGDGYFGSVNAASISEEHHDVAVEHVALGVKSKRGIRSEICSVALRRR